MPRPRPLNPITDQETSPAVADRSTLQSPDSNRTRVSTDSLSPILVAVLNSVRRLVRRYVVIDSLLLVAAVVLGWFWLGFVLDYTPVRLGGTEMPAAARWILLAIVVGCVIYVLGRHLLGRLVRSLPDDSLALLLERHHPGLGGRLITAVELVRRDRTGDTHDADFLRRVHQQAIDDAQSIEPARVVSSKPLRRKLSAVIPLLILTILFLIAFPAAFSRAASRLTMLSNDPWPRRA